MVMLYCIFKNYFYLFIFAAVYEIPVPVNLLNTFMMHAIIIYLPVVSTV